MLFFDGVKFLRFTAAIHFCLRSLSVNAEGKRWPPLCEQFQAEQQVGMTENDSLIQGL